MKIKFKLLLTSIALIYTSFVFAGGNFYVKDFGAAGDGVTDDGPAIRKAISKAIKAGEGSTVIFEPKKYRLAKYTGNNSQFYFSNISGLTLEGNGAELINNPYNGTFAVVESKDIIIRGFKIDYYPYPFTQGKFLVVNKKEGTVLVKIQEGYENPFDVKWDKQLNNGVSKGKRSFFVIEPDKRSMKKSGNNHYTFLNMKNRGKDLIQFSVPLKDIVHLKANDRLVTSFYAGNGKSNNVIQRSENILFEKVIIYTSREGMNYSISDNIGRVHIKDSKITYKEGTTHLITSHKDGFHCKHNTLGPIIEGGLFEGMMDDAINISVTPYWIIKSLGKNKYKIACRSSRYPRVGNELMTYTPKAGNISRGLKVLSIKKTSDKNIRIVKLNKEIPNLVLFEGTDYRPIGTEKMDKTGLYNLDACGKDYIIRNNRFGDQRRHGVLARAPGGIIEENTFNGLGGNGVVLYNLAGAFYEGPIPSNITIRNNTFIKTNLAPIEILANGKGAYVKDITIDNNVFKDWYDSPNKTNKEIAAIMMRKIDGAKVINNTIYKASRMDIRFDSQVYGVKVSGKNIEIKANNILYKESSAINAVNVKNAHITNNQFEEIK
ncbi:glycosyl hydrolase family 28-related protein [Flavicella sp.]|uniref:right-handed parallel beta-helix repeat-containing protein n=1 Tax=Flavicella sp. TaxID=2957742 RepID=UPI002625D8E9|nr:glycosyl hydrolase family 28-related protein [Flavicella sp.]MDG1804272.1 glycosyl hydrolase family 28-related protein [Flavicella sp.]